MHFQTGSVRRAVSLEIREIGALPGRAATSCRPRVVPEILVEVILIEQQISIIVLENAALLADSPLPGRAAQLLGFQTDCGRACGVGIGVAALADWAGCVFHNALSGDILAIRIFTRPDALLICFAIQISSPLTETQLTDTFR